MVLHQVPFFVFDNRRELVQVADIDQKIFVTFPGNEHEMEIEKEKWSNIKYRLNEETNKPEEEEIGTFSQYPIRLAWAITIHKSQGLTFEKAIIDAGASFAAGQVYVALSRLTSLDGLVLYSRIAPDNISTDPRVISFTQNEQKENELLSLLQQEQRLFANRMLLQSFEWLKLINEIQVFIGGYDKRVIPKKEDAVKWAADILKIVKTQDDIAKKFSRQLKQILIQTTVKDDTQLKERTLAAQSYFDKELSQIVSLIQLHKEKYTSKKKVKKYQSDLSSLKSIIERKRKELINAVEMAGNIFIIREKDQASGQNLELPNNVQSPEHHVDEVPLHQ